MPAAGFELHLTPALPFVRRISLAAVRAPAVALGAVSRCRPVVRGSGAVIGMGGYVSVPAVLAAARERVPVVLHEQNAVPGLANRVLSRMARVVALSFGDAARWFHRGARVVVTGNPVRAEILEVPHDRERLAKDARTEFGLDDERRTVVAFGGSQGARSLNLATVGACRLLKGRGDLQVLLITGPSHAEAVRRELQAPPSRLLVRTNEFVERMEVALAVADLVVARAGATTIAEVTACGLPVLLVPYPHATGHHQDANARALQRAGGASVMLDHQLTATSLAARIEALVDHEERLTAMAERSESFGRPQAAASLADLVEEVSP